jgi:hypothetical protein
MGIRKYAAVGVTESLRVSVWSFAGLLLFSLVLWVFLAFFMVFGAAHPESTVEMFRPSTREMLMMLAALWYVSLGASVVVRIVTWRGVADD